MGNNKKSQQKKPHFCYHYGVSGHTHPNCYKWLTTQQSNSMVSSGNQNQFPSSFAHLGDLLKALMFLSNLKGFNSSPSSPNQKVRSEERFFQGVEGKGLKWFSHFFSLSPYVYALLVCFALLFLS